MSGTEQEHGDITIVAPNGYRLAEKYHPQQTVAIVLKHAVQKLIDEHQLDPGVPADAYILVLGETPLETSMTLAQSGVQVAAVLKIRAKRIPSDGHAPGTR